jgi:hypothetical protein
MKRCVLNVALKELYTKRNTVIHAILGLKNRKEKKKEMV